MCGISGIISKTLGLAGSEAALNASLKIMRHRGPDDTGVYSEAFGPWNLSLGMDRLSIIDLTAAGNQPMFLDSLVLVYNGEVYNYLEIKEELLKKGHIFRGRSDAEVILHAFQEWGIEFVSKLNGMFSIALLDKKAHKIYLIRDRVGEKPLYYFFDTGLFVFSSELKGLMIHNFIPKDIDSNSLFNYFIYNYVAAPNTLFRCIKQVCPGEIKIIDYASDTLFISESRYWSIPGLSFDESISEERALSDLDSLLRDAVKIRLRSDVPEGVFLSGGIDSTLIASIASEMSPNIKSFSIGYKDRRFDESIYAEYAAKRMKVDHTNIILRHEVTQLDFKKLAYVSDDCASCVSLIPFNDLVVNARKKVKVALSGVGGDEFFCGYTRSYKIIPFLFKYRGLLKYSAPLSFINSTVKLLADVLTDADNLENLTAQFIARRRLGSIRQLINVQDKALRISQRINIDNEPFLRQNPTFWKLNYYDGGGNYLSGQVLNITDKISMSQSLETRTVFTDHRIIEYMSKLPESLVLKSGTDKYLLRRLLSRRIPDKFLVNRKKQGFAFPLITDFKDDWKRELESSRRILAETKPRLLNFEHTDALLSEPSNGSNNELQSRAVFLLHFLNYWKIN